jgi:hypothetical protein
VPPAGAPASPGACGGALQDAVATLARARRGLLVLGELPGAADAAAALRVGAALGWPVAADVLSGARVGAVLPSPDPEGHPVMLHHFDHLLLDAAAGAAAAGGGKHPDGVQALRAALRPDAVLQLGGRLTSKRLQAFLEGSAMPDVESGRCGHARRWFRCLPPISEALAAALAPAGGAYSAQGCTSSHPSFFPFFFLFFQIVILLGLAAG